MGKKVRKPQVAIKGCAFFKGFFLTFCAPAPCGPALCSGGRGRGASPQAQRAPGHLQRGRSRAQAALRPQDTPLLRELTGRDTKKMKILLRITLFAILYTSFVPELNESVAPIFSSTNITMDTRRHPLPTSQDGGEGSNVKGQSYRNENLLKCHVCRGTFECLGPQNCDIKEKFCVIAEINQEKENNVIKYCSITCPFIEEYYGRAFQHPIHLACCAEELCNFKRLGSGHRFCASAVVVTMAFIASFLKPSGLDYDILG
ncbi:uncharacterized protein LOC141499422 [Macrotis lagotis]|uniref:uncharacterized protein LOC141499422 n=1 Tax=Macrotis lagotis TaxID=92651 RepID=UPI003D699512